MCARRSRAETTARAHAMKVIARARVVAHIAIHTLLGGRGPGVGAAVYCPSRVQPAVPPAIVVVVVLAMSVLAHMQTRLNREECTPRRCV